MMAMLTKLRVRKKQGRTEFLVLVNHPMENGRRQNEATKTPIPAQYIEQLTFALNDQVVAEACLGPGVASNPVTGIAVDNAKSGDRVTVHWVDNRGESGRAETLVG